MKTNIHLWSYLAQFFLEWKMFQAIVVERIRTHIHVQSPFFTCICLMAGVPTAIMWPGKLRRVTSHRIRYWYVYRVSRDMEASGNVNLGTRYVYTCGRGMRKGEKGGGKTEHKRHIHGNDVIPLREVWYMIFFFESLAVYEITWKNVVEPDRPQATICSMRVAC